MLLSNLIFFRISIEKLPLELLLHIFSFLPIHSKVSVALVCKRWRDIIYDPSQWRTVQARISCVSGHRLSIALNSFQLRDINTIIVSLDHSKKSFHRLLKGSSVFVRNLSLLCCDLSDTVMMDCPRLSFGSLKCLDLHGTAMSNEVLLKLCISLPLLQQLKLSNFCYDRKPNKESWMSIIIQHLSNLKDLDLKQSNTSLSALSMLCAASNIRLNRLCYNENLTMTFDDVLHMLSGHWTSLEHLDLRLVPPSSPRDVQLSRLRSLKLAGSPLSIVPGVISKASWHFPNLQALDMSSSMFVCDELVTLLTHELPQLKLLNISYSNVTSTGVNAVLTGLPCLEIFTIDGLKLLFDIVIEQCSTLQSFSCVNCGVPPSVIVAKISKLKNFTYLRYRSMQYERKPQWEIYRNGVKVSVLSMDAAASGDRYFKPHDSCF